MGPLTTGGGGRTRSGVGGGGVGRRGTGGAGGFGEGSGAKIFFTSPGDGGGSWFKSSVWILP
ncbi:MAG: hypothetical protein EPO39_10540 [Candidatus Manganitrophaceae bacterium]|nr:MAG: hypothetical protein EPO39_10540 [Candidatus Manganitrophaceae bacterium]